MRNRSLKGFTLIELLIVIAIIGILAAVLIPNLLNARERAFDTAAQTCLKELGVNAEVFASVDPFDYADAPAYDGVPEGINACENVTVIGGPTGEEGALGTGFAYTGQRLPSDRVYQIADGTGVTFVRPGE